MMIDYLHFISFVCIQIGRARVCAPFFAAVVLFRSDRIPTEIYLHSNLCINDLQFSLVNF